MQPNKTHQTTAIIVNFLVFIFVYILIHDSPSHISVIATCISYSSTKAPLITQHSFSAVLEIQIFLLLFDKYTYHAHTVKMTLKRIE